MTKIKLPARMGRMGEEYTVITLEPSNGKRRDPQVVIRNGKTYVQDKAAPWRYLEAQVSDFTNVPEIS